MASRNHHVNREISERFRRRQAKRGLVRVEVSVPSDKRDYIREVARNLREEHLKSLI